MCDKSFERKFRIGETVDTGLMEQKSTIVKVKKVNPDGPRRTYTHCHNLNRKKSSIWKELRKYNPQESYQISCHCAGVKSSDPLEAHALGCRAAKEANQVSSLTERGLHAPVVDLDVPAYLVPSSRPGHSHLYIDVEMSRKRWMILMLGFWLSGVVEFGYIAWSLRRGQNHVRVPWAKKGDPCACKTDPSGE